jgi:hypothetical protein
MITSEQCKAYLTECKVLGTSRGISIQRATAIMGICHALVALAQRLKRYDRVVQEETCSQAPPSSQARPGGDTPGLSF